MDGCCSMIEPRGSRAALSSEHCFCALTRRRARPPRRPAGGINLPQREASTSSRLDRPRRSSRGSIRVGSGDRYVPNRIDRPASERVPAPLRPLADSGGSRPRKHCRPVGSFESFANPPPFRASSFFRHHVCHYPLFFFEIGPRAPAFFGGNVGAPGRARTPAGRLPPWSAVSSRLPLPNTSPRRREERG
jgi:hypothetical protein